MAPRDKAEKDAERAVALLLCMGAPHHVQEVDGYMRGFYKTTKTIPGVFIKDFPGPGRTAYLKWYRMSKWSRQIFFDHEVWVNREKVIEYRIDDFSTLRRRIQANTRRAWQRYRGGAG